MIFASIPARHDVAPRVAPDAGAVYPRPGLAYYMGTLDSQFLKLLAAALPAECVVRDASELLAYESDALVHLRSTPGAVVLPGSAAEVQTVVRLCHQHGVPFVARGHGTGLSGGALPHPGIERF